MCTVLPPPGDNPIAVNKYINININIKNEEAKARYRAVKIQPQWVVTAGKQTTTHHILFG